MRAKIAFFDIDGTIVNFGAKDISPRVSYALNYMQKEGCRLFIATGRPPYIMPVFHTVRFDGVMGFNGSYCYDSEGIIYSNPLDRKDALVVVENAKKKGHPVFVATDRRMGSNFFNADIDEYMSISGNSCNILDDYDAILNENMYMLIIGAGEDEEKSFLAGTTKLTTARWWDRAFDVIPGNCGKAVGMEKILAHYGIPKEEAIAFGDGGNDLDMIEYAGIGVAMGNALDHVKAAADYVTCDCADDGVYEALLKFGLIPPYAGAY